MLALYGITAFVPQSTISQIESYFRLESGPFETERVTIRDHLGEPGTMTYVFIGNAQIGLAPSNDFHYPGDFEVGLTIRSGHTIAELELILREHSYDFENGYFAGDKKRGYYLIPRRGDRFTPFFVVSDEDATKNWVLPAVQLLTLQVDEKSVSTTQDFMSLTGLGRNADIAARPGSGNRIIEAVFDLGDNPTPPGLLRFGDVELEIGKTNWRFRQGGALR